MKDFKKNISMYADAGQKNSSGQVVKPAHKPMSQEQYLQFKIDLLKKKFNKKS